MRASLCFLLVLITFIPIVAGVPAPPPVRRPTSGDVKRTRKDVHTQLEQLHHVIDALQQQVKDMHDGHNKKTKEHTDRMTTKFKKLSAVITKLSHQNGQLHKDNKRLRTEKNTLVNKISNLEKTLNEQAALIDNIGAEVWLRNTASELQAFLKESGLEHFASPKFSPIIAGLVSNGVIIVPLAMTSLFLLNYAKQLNILRILMALNLFDLGFAASVLLSSVLLLGDPFEGMRHISEVNFVFIQLVVATVFWITMSFLVAAVIRNRKNRAWRYAAAEIVVRGVVAMDYSRRVWVPVMERDHLPIALPALAYVVYVVSALFATKLTSLANRYAVSEYQQIEKREDAAIMVPIVSQESF